LKIRD
jgi:hypothetical protein